jgi:hypothetical protein
MSIKKRKEAGLRSIIKGREYWDIDKSWKLPELEFKMMSM